MYTYVYVNVVHSVWKEVLEIGLTDKRRIYGGNTKGEQSVKEV